MNTPAPLDLAAFDTRKGAEAGMDLALTHPQTGATLPATLQLLGADSDAWHEKQAELLQARVNRLAKNKKNLASVEELEHDSIELLVAVTTGWRDLVLDGAPLAWNPENARRLYTRFPWIREQAFEAVNDRGNFLPRSATS